MKSIGGLAVVCLALALAACGSEPAGEGGDAAMADDSAMAGGEAAAPAADDGAWRAAMPAFVTIPDNATFVSGSTYEAAGRNNGTYSFTSPDAPDAVLAAFRASLEAANFAMVERDRTDDAGAAVKELEAQSPGDGTSTTGIRVAPDGSGTKFDVEFSVRK